MFLSEWSNCLEIGQLDEWVGQRFHVDDAGVVTQGGAPTRWILCVEHRVFDPQTTQVVVEQAARSPVENVLHEEMVATGEQTQQGPRNGGHAAPGNQRGLGLLEGRDTLAEYHVVRAVAEAEVSHVVVALAVILERAGLEDRGRYGTANPRPR